MTATKIQPGDDLHLTSLMAPHSLNFVTGADRAALLAYGRDVFAAARDSKCLAQIEEPAQPVAEICSASHDDAEFGERAIKPLCDISGFEYGTPLYAGAAPAAAAPRGEYPHEQMDAMALDRYKVVPSNASMLWSHAVVAGDGTQQLYVGREVECQNMARKFAGAFLDGAFAFHSTAAAPTAPAAPALEAPAAPAGDLALIIAALEHGQPQMAHYAEPCERHAKALAAARRMAAAPQAPAEAQEPAANLHDDGYWTPTKTEAGRALNERLMRAGSPRIPVYTHPAPRQAAPQAPNCTPCSGSGEDPEGYLTHGRGPDDHTVDGPCRECDGTGAAPQAPAAPMGVVGWVKDECTGPGAFDPMFVRGAAPLPAGYVANYRPVVYAAAPAAPAVDATSDTALLDAMQRHRIALVPEFEGPWDAEIYNDDAEARPIASGNTPRDALRAALAAQAAAKGATNHG